MVDRREHADFLDDAPSKRRVVRSADHPKAAAQRQLQFVGICGYRPLVQTPLPIVSRTIARQAIAVDPPPQVLPSCPVRPDVVLR